MRLAFMGTPDFAVPTLDALVAAGHEIAVVYCQPPRPAGRGKAPRASAVQRAAEAAGLDIRVPLTLREARAQAEFAALGLDAAVVAAYGLILPVPILEAPRLGCINVHASLLPRWRGAAPIQRAILAGDEKTGVTIMKMEKGLDTGPILALRETEVDRKSAGELNAELAGIGAALVREMLERLPEIEPVPQIETAITYAPKIDKAEARLDFGRAAIEVERQVRAFAPEPGAWFEFGGERIKVHRAGISAQAGPAGMVLDSGLAIGCAEGAIVPVMVQRAGRAPMKTADLLRGFPIPPGARLQ
jgi:methionyl-tRNA formyltransferase